MFWLLVAFLNFFLRGMGLIKFRKTLGPDSIYQKLSKNEFSENLAKNFGEFENSAGANQ
jgi:hypothetical protein